MLFSHQGGHPGVHVNKLTITVLDDIIIFEGRDTIPVKGINKTRKSNDSYKNISFRDTIPGDTSIKLGNTTLQKLSENKKVNRGGRGPHTNGRMEGKDVDDHVDLRIGTSFPLQDDHPVRHSLSRIINNGRNLSLQSWRETVVPFSTDPVFLGKRTSISQDDLQVLLPTEGESFRRCHL